MNAALVPAELRTLAALSAAGLLDSCMPSPHNADEVALFPALSLDDAGHPLPIVHSDFAFAFLFGTPAPERRSSAVRPPRESTS